MTEQPEIPPVDVGNPHLNPDAPATISTANVQAPNGTPKVCLTVRTIGATVTVFLDRAFAANIADQLAKAARELPPALVVPQLDLSKLDLGRNGPAEPLRG